MPAISPAMYVWTRTTLGAAGVMQAVNVPRGARVCLVRPIAVAALITEVGADGAAIGAAYGTLTADSWFPVWCAGRPTFNLASPAGAGVVETRFLP